jgi:putative hydrolase of the HAD superfamily
MENNTITVLLFDLGGVLVTWEGVSGLVGLTGGRLDSEQARKYFLHSPWMTLFESGMCSPEEFGEGVVSDLNLSLKPNEFLDTFLSWDRGFESGAFELLEKLRPRYLLGCVSNNNILHWARLCSKYNMSNYFHRLYPSHETGLVKPSGKVFEHVVSDIGGSPGQFLFFDDNIECVDNACKTGLMACRVSGVKEVEQVLKDRKLL